MVHLCNMKMLAASTRHKSKGRHYDIDGFITQLLASRKFDDLAEKLAEKAANKIMHIDAAPYPVERATDGNETYNSTESTQDVNKKQSNREDVKKYENTQLNVVELRKDFTGKIDPQAVINATISLSENLQLKYKYFKKNAHEKKVKNNQDPLPKTDTKEDLTKQNKTIVPSDFEDHNNKIQEPISNQSAIDKNQMETEKESFDENKRSRDDTQNDDPKEDSNRNSCHSGTGGEIIDSSKKRDHTLEGHGPGHEQTVFREAQHSRRPQDKAIVKQEVSHVDNGIREEKALSLEKDNQKHLTRSEENIIEKVEQNEGEPVKRSTEEIIENENGIPQFRAHEDSFEENKATADYSSNGGIDKSKASDDTDDRSPEERSPEDQSSKEQSAEDPNSSKLKPVIRKEGDKFYTYVRAPEYEDYHDKLAKWQKEHPVNPADFM